MHKEIESRLDACIEKWGLQANKKKMFGGIAYLLDDKMCFVTSSTDKVIVRVPHIRKNELLKQPHVHEAQMGQRIMKNWIMIEADQLSDAELELLLAIGRDVALSL